MPFYSIHRSKKLAPLFISIFLSVFVNKINAQKKDSIENYFHIKMTDTQYGGYYRNADLLYFVLQNVDTAGNKTWRSGQIVDFEKDGSDYFVKISIPAEVQTNSKQLWCTAFLKRRSWGDRQWGNNSDVSSDTFSVRYGGTTLSKIKLLLKTNPEGAETFLIPNRIWQMKIQFQKWQSNAEILEKYRVDNSSTNTYVYIDETVYKIIFKKNNAYKSVTHYTKSETIEKEQTVSINLNN